MKRRRIPVIATIIIVGGLSALLGCTSIDPIEPGAVNWGSADFSTFAALGANFTAGYQSGGLVEKYQEVSYPSLIAAAARVNVFEMARISEPGIPPLMVFKSLFPTVVLDTLDGLGSSKNPLHPAQYNNLGIPLATANEVRLRGSAPDPQKPFFQIVLRDDGVYGPNAVAQAVALGATFATVWVGITDVWGAVLKGDDDLMTPAMAFNTDITALINDLKTDIGDVVVANVPDITAFPYSATVPPFLPHPVTGLPVPLIGEYGGSSGPLPTGTLLTLPASGLIRRGIGVPDTIGGTGFPLPDSVVIDPTEVQSIKERIDDYNSSIANIAMIWSVPVVDMFSFFDEVKASGVMLRGEVYTMDYVTGGLFSVDGFHPSTLGYYAIAREFIRTINGAFGASLPDPPFPAEAR